MQKIYQPFRFNDKNVSRKKKYKILISFPDFSCMHATGACACTDATFWAGVYMYYSHTVYMLIRGVEAGSTFPTIVMLQTMKIYKRGHLFGMICSTVLKLGYRSFR